MIEIKTDVRKDLNDLDNISNLLNYAVNATINKHYKDKATTDKEKKEYCTTTYCKLFKWQ